MIAVCMDGFKGTITEGKQYDIQSLEYRAGGLIVAKHLSYAVLFYNIVNDKGQTRQYEASRFKLLSEIREERLKEIGI